MSHAWLWSLMGQVQAGDWRQTKVHGASKVVRGVAASEGWAFERSGVA